MEAYYGQIDNNTHGCCVGWPAGETPGAAADAEDPQLQHEYFHRPAHVRCDITTWGPFDSGCFQSNPSAHTVVCSIHLMRVTNIILSQATRWHKSTLKCDEIYGTVCVSSIRRHHKEEVPGDIFDLLLTFTDFIAFKEMFLEYRAVSCLRAGAHLKTPFLWESQQEIYHIKIFCFCFLVGILAVCAIFHKCKLVSLFS